MERVNTRLSGFVAMSICLVLFVSATPATPRAAQQLRRSPFTEAAWRLDRANMFSALAGRANELSDQVKLQIQIGTLAGFELSAVENTQANLQQRAKEDARAVPPRPSDDEVLALKERFNKALIDLDHEMVRFDVGRATTVTVTAAIISAASILR